MKCDEGRPSCQKCLSTGRQCDGYDTHVNDTTGGTLRPTNLSKTNIEASIGLIKSPSSIRFGTEKEHQAFQFFRQYTANQLTGFYADDFWNNLVLRATHYEPALHHAVVALGSLHERFLKNDGLISKSSDKSDLQLYHDDFAVRQYNSAIQCLVGAFCRKEKQAIDVCLLSCILFACFEVCGYCSTAMPILELLTLGIGRVDEFLWGVLLVQRPVENPKPELYWERHHTLSFPAPWRLILFY